jgi:hypothetical protein
MTRYFSTIAAAITAAIAAFWIVPGSAASAAGAAEIAAVTDAHAYALVVGSNPGGKGQDTLRYAESDARHMARVLSDLGGYQASQVRLVLRPSPGELLRALDDIAAELERHAARGTPTRFFFYYSGHARASALNLGARELSLEYLRKKLLGLPTALTIVVLDACQSGAFSRVKGAEPTADFSFNSVSRLNATGVAVMASSSSTELSQESERLGSSYFTHHLLVALRGAGDSNRDGRVSLDEAYEYAYQRTLASTAITAVGSQHVTLETALKGKGDVALSYPARANAHLNLSPSLDADIVVLAEPEEVVVAELHKSKGAPLRLALPGGKYTVLVRGQAGARRCLVNLRDNQVTGLERAHCVALRLEPVTTRGDQAAPASVSVSASVSASAPASVSARQLVDMELSGGLSIPGTGVYTDRLGDFGFRDQRLVLPHLRLAGAHGVHDNIHIVAELAWLDTGHFRRDNPEGAHEFSWSTTGVGVYLRGVLPAAGGLVVPFVQAGAGVARARTSYEQNDPGPDVETFWGYHMGVAGGVQIMPWRRFGAFLRIGYDYAPIIENLVGDTHNSGGTITDLGVRARF